MHAPTAGPTVLVVDDEPMVREVVARYLERDGIGVHEVGNGDDAMRGCARTAPTSSCST